MSEKKIVIIDKVNIEKPNTKDFIKSLEKLKITGKLLLVWSDKNENLIESARNIPSVSLSNVGSLGAFDVMRSETAVFLKDAILKIEERYSK